MEIREVTTYNEKAPFTGFGVWICFETKYRKALLIHPVLLTELVLTEYEFVKSAGDRLWPLNETKTSFNFERFRQSFKDRINLFIRTNKPFPLNTVARVISELDEISEEEAYRFIKSLDQSAWDDCIETSLRLDKTNREYALKKDVDIQHIKGRPRTIVEIFKEVGPSSIYKITELATGRLKTKCKISRTVTYFVHRLAAEGVLEIVA